MTINKLKLLSLSTLTAVTVYSCGVSKKEGKEYAKKPQYANFNTTLSKVESDKSRKKDSFPVSFKIKCSELNYEDPNYEVIPGEKEKGKIQFPLNTNCAVEINHVKFGNDIYKPKAEFKFTTEKKDGAKLEIKLPKDQVAFFDEKTKKSLFLYAKHADKDLEFYYALNPYVLTATFLKDAISDNGVTTSNSKTLDVKKVGLEVLYTHLNSRDIYTLIVKNKDYFESNCIILNNASKIFETKKPPVDELKKQFEENTKSHTNCNVLKSSLESKGNWNNYIKDEHFFIFKHQGEHQAEYDVIRVGNESEIKLLDKLSNVPKVSGNSPSQVELLTSIKKNIKEFKVFIEDKKIQTVIKEKELTEEMEQEIQAMEEIANKKLSAQELSKAIEDISNIVTKLKAKISEV